MTVARKPPGTPGKRTLPGPEKAPYRDGNLQEYAGYGFGDGESWGDSTSEWRPNKPFMATLVLTGTERGRSAMRFLWKDTVTGNTYPMFATDIAALITSKDGASNGTATGEWIVMKRGQNYGIARYEA